MINLILTLLLMLILTPLYALAFLFFIVYHTIYGGLAITVIALLIIAIHIYYREDVTL